MALAPPTPGLPEGRRISMSLRDPNSERLLDAARTASQSATRSMKNDFALVEAGALGAGADGVGGLAHEQRFIAGDQIGPGGLTCEVRAEGFEGELQGADYSGFPRSWRQPSWPPGKSLRSRRIFPFGRQRGNLRAPHAHHFREDHRG